MSRSGPRWPLRHQARLAASWPSTGARVPRLMHWRSGASRFNRWIKLEELVTKEAEASLSLISTKRHDRGVYALSRFHLLSRADRLSLCFAFSVTFARFLS